ncbi:BTAD domain-containing putative transcriptional regulator [Phycicoccus flavus]|uniref:AfsR/SARP family transcriptional regulator n=1 Tax=Phycicoccus flavus TaxID=2502783 RepID=A0A8T6R7T0_9MICO|nr:BTAD domain-containing putative transcriptional regulator [Phycicoccus flavus]NHA69480.1 AfsR/SARP family transcriptional regulator [Phycicoccus flavus]
MDGPTTFRILGPLDIRRADGEAISVSGAKERALLTRLLLEPGRAVSDERLLRDVWPEADDATSLRESLQVRISRLRRQLAGAARITRAGAGYRLDADPEQVDATRFERLIGESADAAPSEAVRLLEQALALWSSPPLAELSENGGDGHRERLMRLEREARTRLGHSLSAAGRPARAVPELAALAAEHPLDEAVATSLVTALHADGRSAEAVDVHRATVERMADEGLDPTPGFRALVTDVLRHDVTTHPRTFPRLGPDTEQDLGRPSFIGRRRELDDVVDALVAGATPLVTLWGPGGVGKTRLALEAARRTVGAFDEPPIVVDASRLESADQLSASVARAAGIVEQAAGPPDLTAAFRGRSVLVVLDNMEHLLDATDVVGSLVAAGGGIRVLATSRAVLGLGVERVQRVMPFPLQVGAVGDVDARTFLVRRAEAMGARLSAEPATEGDPLTQIAHRLDGLPLALELAAARLRTLSPSTLNQQLSSTLGVLGSLRDLPGRQRTLHATLQWSAELLDDDARDLLGCFGGFAAPARLGAVTAVSGTPDVLGPLTQLVDHALVHHVPTADDEGAYATLETVTEWATSQLRTTDRLAEVQARHADHFLDHAHEVTADLLTGEQVAATARLTEQEPDILRALVHARDHGDPERLRRAVLGLWRWWFGIGANRTAVEWLEQAAALDDGDPDQVRVLSLLGLSHASLGQREQALAACEACEEVVGRTGLDPASVPEVDGARWTHRLESGDPAGAVDAALTAAHTYRTTGRQVLASEMLVRAGVAAAGAGDLDLAERLHQQALPALRAQGPRWELAGAHNNVAHLALARGDAKAALTQVRTALELFGRLPMARDDWIAYETLMSIRRVLGQVEEARHAATEAMRRSARAGDRAALTRVRLELAGLEVDAGAPAAAAEQLLDATQDELAPQSRWQLLATAAMVLLAAGDGGGAAIAAELAADEEPDPTLVNGHELRGALDRARRADGEAVSFHALVGHLESVRAAR